MLFGVAKSDGSIEVYFHTKVMGSIAAALGESGNCEEGLTDHLAEAVTEYILRRCSCATVDTDEIHAMIEVVLSETGYVEAALCLHNHRLTRGIKRSRVEVVYNHRSDVGGNCDDDTGFESYAVQPWNKSVIVQVLEGESELPRGVARTVASAVEDKVLRMGFRRVRSSLVRELVESELWAMREAEKALAEQIEEEGEEYAGCHNMNLVS
ncbi:MAG: hypothetical protein J7L69_02890 [Desulfobulbaceae bacterium]|nr:hypothetical protein [Desulfobulbaceae bacterium]